VKKADLQQYTLQKPRRGGVSNFTKKLMQAGWGESKETCRDEGTAVRHSFVVNERVRRDEHREGRKLTYETLDILTA